MVVIKSVDFVTELSRTNVPLSSFKYTSSEISVTRPAYSIFFGISLVNGLYTCDVEVNNKSQAYYAYPRENTYYFIYTYTKALTESQPSCILKDTAGNDILTFEDGDIDTADKWSSVFIHPASRITFDFNLI